MIKLDNTKTNNTETKKNNDLFILFYEYENKFWFSNKILSKKEKVIKSYKIKDKKPFYIVKINEKYFYVKKENFISIKEYIYSNYTFENIYISDCIDPISINIKNDLFTLHKGFTVKKDEFKDITKLSSLDDFFIFEYLENQEKTQEKDNEIIKKIESENDFLENKLSLKKYFLYLDSFNKVNNADSLDLLNKLFLTFEEFRYSEIYDYYDYDHSYDEQEEYKVPSLKEDFFIELTTPLNNHKRYLNLKNINSINIIENNYKIKVDDPFDKKYKFIISIFKVQIIIENKEFKFFCFKNDYLKNNILKFSKNNMIKGL